MNLTMPDGSRASHGMDIAGVAQMALDLFPLRAYRIFLAPVIR